MALRLYKIRLAQLGRDDIDRTRNHEEHENGSEACRLGRETSSLEARSLASLAGLVASALRAGRGRWGCRSQNCRVGEWIWSALSRRGRWSRRYGDSRFVGGAKLADFGDGMGVEDEEPSNPIVVQARRTEVGHDFDRGAKFADGLLEVSLQMWGEVLHDAAVFASQKRFTADVRAAQCLPSYPRQLLRTPFNNHAQIPLVPAPYDLLNGSDQCEGCGLG